MKTILQGILFVGFMCCTPISALAGENLENPCAAEEYQIGVMVKRVAEAIDAPGKSESLQAIAKYGTDSRYYVMIRGWLIQELSGVESQILAAQEDATNAKLRRKADFLEKSIQRIDFE
jgi:hypothetical protein